MQFDTSKLKGRIYEVYGNQKEFCKAINAHDSNVSGYLNGRSTLSQESIEAWAKALKIEPSEIGLYFFARAFDETQK